MAFHTVNFSLNVALMGEIDKVRKIVNLDPWDRFFGFPELKQFDDFGLFTNHLFVAIDALVHAGYAGRSRAACVNVAILAGNAIVAGMNLVTELDRLGGRTVGEKRQISPVADYQTGHSNSEHPLHDYYRAECRSNRNRHRTQISLVAV